MKGLLLKDCYTITKQLKIFLIVIPVMAVTGGFFMSAFAVLLGAVLPMTAIAYDERSKWDELAAMMPYSKGNLVLSKYLLGYICMSGAAILVVTGQLLMKTLGIVYTDSSINMLLFAIVGGLTFIAINTPILFKFGSEKGRFVYLITLALIGASGSILKDIDNNMLLKILETSPVFLLGIAVILNLISILISINIKAE